MPVTLKSGCGCCVSYTKTEPIVTTANSHRYGAWKSGGSSAASSWNGRGQKRTPTDGSSSPASDTAGVCQLSRTKTCVA